MFLLTPSVEIENLDEARDHHQHGDDRACMQVRSLVSGFPKARRLRRPLLVLQFCIDDSKNGPDFVLAGYVATVENWEHFSDDWQERLAHSGLTYLKGNTLTRILRQLEPDERELRLAEFGQLIRKYVSYGLEFSVSYLDYKWFTKRAKKMGRVVARRFNNPHIIGFGLLLDTVAIIENARGTLERIECIFDRDIDNHKFLEREYRLTYSFFPKHIKQMMSPDPLFRDDREFMPLQAADLRAWYSHRCLATKPPEGRLWQELEHIEHFPMRSERDKLEMMLRSLKVPTRALHHLALDVAKRMEGHGIRMPSGKIL
jgi:hypothetical protein